MFARAPALPQTGGPGPAQTTPMTQISYRGMPLLNLCRSSGRSVLHHLYGSVPSVTITLAALRAKIKTRGTWPRDLAQSVCVWVCVCDCVCVYKTL